MSGIDNDPYENVPHNGKEFQEGRDTFYWTFSRAAIGMTVDEWRHGMTLGPKIDKISRHATKNWLRSHVMAVANASVGGKNITKWKHLEGHGNTRRENGILRLGIFYSSSDL